MFHRQTTDGKEIIISIECGNKMVACFSTPMDDMAKMFICQNMPECTTPIQTFEVILANLSKIAFELNAKEEDIDSISVDIAVAYDEFYIRNNNNEIIGVIEVVPSKRAIEKELNPETGEGYEDGDDYELFESNHSFYMPLTDDRKWAYTILGEDEG